MLDISGYFRPLIFDGFGTPTNQTSKQNTRENSYDPNFSKPLDPSNIGAFDSRASISSSNSTQAQIAASLSDRQFSSRYPGNSTARMANSLCPVSSGELNEQGHPGAAKDPHVTAPMPVRNAV